MPFALFQRYYLRGGLGITKTFKYAGFISYAHHDERIATRLHKGLETFRVPKGMVDNKVLSPIFRDASELTAHHSLPEKINEALATSRFLIVLCSPAAKASFWVNEEIRQFRMLHGKRRILCALLSGTPETSFPPALTEQGDEPLAANLDGGRDVFRLGQTQLAASMLGVGLDRLIQREAQRRRNRLRLLSGASLAFAAVMGAMAWTAVDARNAAETSRSEAEKMVEFMLTDLKSDLEDVGRLKILDNVGKNVTQYYNAIPLPDMDDDRLAREARARHLLGQVALDTGNMELAKTEIEAAYNATQEVMRRNPKSTEAIFAHAQSEFWRGRTFTNEKNFAGALPFMERYADLGVKLYEANPTNFKFLKERASGANNLGSLYMRLGNISSAREYFIKAESYFRETLTVFPDEVSLEGSIANVLSGLGNIAVMQDKPEEALTYRKKQIAIYDAQLLRSPANKIAQYQKTQAQSRLITDGLLDDNPDRFSTTLLLTLDAYDALISYDPSNRRWGRNYMLYLHALQDRWARQPDTPRRDSIQRRVAKTLQKLSNL